MIETMKKPTGPNIPEAGGPVRRWSWPISRLGTKKAALVTGPVVTQHM